MSRNLVPMKVIIRLNNEGQALYPNFNTLNIVQASGLDWARYIDVHGLGWHYDKTSGHKEESIDSPFGTQQGVLIVPKTFVEEAVIAFPLDCISINEVELEDFYNNKSHVNEPDELFDMSILEGIRVKNELGIALTQQQQNAIDPQNNTPGIKKNKKRFWNDYKQETCVKIVNIKK